MAKQITKTIKFTKEKLKYEKERNDLIQLFNKANYKFDIRKIESAIVIIKIKKKS